MNLWRASETGANFPDMSWFAKSKDHLPLTWWKGHPVYFAAVLALGGVISMVVTALLLAIHAPALSNVNGAS